MDFAAALIDAVDSPRPWSDGAAQVRLTKTGVQSNPTLPEINFNLVQLWVDRAEKNASRCAVCFRIAQGNRELGEFGTIKVGGVDFSPESQIAHLSRCAG